MRNGLLEPAVLMVAATLAVACGPKDAKVVSYASEVQPVLMKRCSGCHAPGRQAFTASGLDTTSHAALMKGGKNGPLIQPGDPFTSARNLLFTGRSHGRKHLSNDEFNRFKFWVCQGANNN